MTQVVSNITVRARHTVDAPLELAATTLTHYIVKNRSDIAVMAQANKGLDGATRGTWLRIRPYAEALLQHDDGSAITQLRFYLHDSPRYVSANGDISRAQAANLEITTR